MEEYKQYRRKQIAELADWEPDFDMTGVSVSEADKENGSPKLGDKIARNPKNHNDRWLVAEKYFADNFEPLGYTSPAEPGPGKDDERIYPCADCGKMRSKAEGGTTFTVCDECWDKRHPKNAEPAEDMVEAVKQVLAHDFITCGFTHENAPPHHDCEKECGVSMDNQIAASNPIISPVRSGGKKHKKCMDCWSEYIDKLAREILKLCQLELKGVKTMNGKLEVKSHLICDVCDVKYHLTCDKCGKLFWHEDGFPTPQVCDKCGEDQIKENK